MPQSLSHILLHITFSTKGRHPLIDTEVEGGLHAYLATVCRNEGCHAYRVGGTDDHVHIVTTLSRTITVAKLLESIKKTTSSWMKTQHRRFQHFYWQRGYGAFSVSPIHLDEVIRYIESQRERHKHVTFQEEFRQLLEKYGIEYDERYVWD